MPRLIGMSRRQFLRRSGAFVVMAGAMPPAPSPAQPVVDESVVQAAALAGTSLGLPGGDVLRGRAFNRAAIYSQPDGGTSVVGVLMSDSVHTFVGLSEDGWWYEIGSGFVQREMLQPITAYEAPPLSEEDGFFEVVAPITAVHEYCSPLARIVGRPPFGAVLHVRDRIADDRGQVWYGVAAGGDIAPFWGWVPAAHMRRWEAPTAPLAAEPAIWIDSAQRKLSAYDGERLLGESALHCPPLPPGTGRLIAYTPAMSQSNMLAPVQGSSPGEERPMGKTWVMAFKPDVGTAVKVYGAYWHNRFGLHKVGASVELPTFAARWLFDLAISASAGDVPVIIE